MNSRLQSTAAFVDCVAARGKSQSLATVWGSPAIKSEPNFPKANALCEPISMPAQNARSGARVMKNFCFVWFVFWESEITCKTRLWSVFVDVDNVFCVTWVAYPPNSLTGIFSVKNSTKFFLDLTKSHTPPTRPYKFFSTKNSHNHSKTTRKNFLLKKITYPPDLLKQFFHRKNIAYRPDSVTKFFWWKKFFLQFFLQWAHISWFWAHCCISLHSGHFPSFWLLFSNLGPLFLVCGHCCHLPIKFPSFCATVLDLGPLYTTFFFLLNFGTSLLY